MSRPQQSRRRKIGTRSCDACKIRKVKCSETPPCDRCVAIGIDCTFNKKQAARGPRSLRPKTIEQIHGVQKSATEVPDDHEVRAPPIPVEVTVESLVLRLCIYRLRLFPVWPIVAVEEVIAALQRDSHDVETRLLAIAVGAATMAQLKLERCQDAGVNDNATATSLEAECQRIRTTLDNGTATLNNIRTAFFLHIYHENLNPGGTKSLLYLREAITLAQILGLHRPLSYRTLSPAEDRLRRRLLWLLFVTERGVAMLHKLPVVLQRGENLPPLEGSGIDEEASILPAFKKLVDLFWAFDQSGAFEILQEATDNAPGTAASLISTLSPEILSHLQQRLQSTPLDLAGAGNEVQKADIFVTSQWMQVLLWRAMLCTWASPDASSILATRPVQIAQEFLDLICQLPPSALESHGSAIEFKVFEIASAVADSLTNCIGLPSTDIRPGNVLLRLQRILATSRGGNRKLLQLLAFRISQADLSACPTFGIMSDPQVRHIGATEGVTNGEPRDWHADVPSGNTGRRPERDSTSLNPSLPQWPSVSAGEGIDQGAESASEGNTKELMSPSLTTGWNIQQQPSFSDILSGIGAGHPPALGGGSPPPTDAFAEIMNNQQWYLSLQTRRPN